MISSPELSKLLVCTALLVGGLSQSSETKEQSARTRAGLEVAREEAAEAVPPEPRQPAMRTFVIHGYEGVNEAQEFGPLKAEFEKRGFVCKIVRSPRTKTKTPHQDRAKVMVEARRMSKATSSSSASPTTGCSCRSWPPSVRYGGS